MARRELNQSRVIVTGASSGIGQALARRLAACQARLLLTARREDRLRQLADEIEPQADSVSWIAGDITDASVRQQIRRHVDEQWQGLDLLINNAGIGSGGSFATSTAEELQRVMEVNFFAPAEFSRELLPQLRQGRHPMIVNVGSVLGHRAVPLKSEYCASKFALHGFSDALRAELAAEGIDVLLVSPSTTRSEFFDVAAGRPAGSSDPASRRGMSTDKVARKSLRAIRRGKHELILPCSGKLLVWADRLLPGLVNRLLAKRASKKNDQ
jgi:short-subunit dehydrogenase